jgi:hypothetical protein
MKFDTTIHTKAYLLQHIDALKEIAENDNAFATSDLANDYEILSTNTSSKDVVTVAHVLAEKQPDWLLSQAIHNPKVLRLATHANVTVAHTLAEHQSGWIKLAPFDDIALMSLEDLFGISVMHDITEKCELDINHYAFFNKHLLSIGNYSSISSKRIKTIAEILVEKNYISVNEMAMRLISTGAAYLHSDPMTIQTGESLISETVQITNESFEPRIALKQALALYSTCAHNISRIEPNNGTSSLTQWQSYLMSAEHLVELCLNKIPDLSESEIEPDIFCEPGDDLVKRLFAQKTFGQIDAVDFETNASDEPISKHVIY